MDLLVIIEGCLRQDRICQKQLYDLCYAYGMKVTQAYCYEFEEAREVLNDSFIKMFSSLDQYDFNKPFLPWFRVIIVRTTINHYHKIKNRIKTIEIPDDNEIISYADDTILSQLEAEDLLKLTHKLPPSYKLILNLFALEGYTHTEIAEMLNISAGTSKSNLSKARAYLTKLISNTKIKLFF
jgi:RNA polymerase sigma factor (sigma-70 family)